MYLFTAKTPNATYGIHHVYMYFTTLNNVTAIWLLFLAVLVAVFSSQLGTLVLVGANKTNIS